MLSIDSLGMNVLATREDAGAFKLRLPFPEPALDRKAVKDQIVIMTRAAAAAGAAEE